MGSQKVYRAGLLRGALGENLRAVGDIAGTFCNLSGSLVNLAHGAVQRQGYLLKRLTDLCKFAHIIM